MFKKRCTQFGNPPSIMRVSCVWQNGIVTEETLAHDQTAKDLKQLLGSKYLGVDSASLVLKIEGREVPDIAVLVGWVGATDRHEVVLNLDLPQVHLDSLAQASQGLQSTQNADSQPEPTPVMPPSAENDLPKKVRIKFADGVYLEVNDDFIVRSDKIYFKDTIVSSLQKASQLTPPRVPLAMLKDTAAVISQRLVGWERELFFVGACLVYVVMTYLYNLLEETSRVLPAFCMTLSSLVLGNIVLDVVAGIRLNFTERFVNLPELYRKVESPEDLVSEVPESALPYISETDRVVNEMRQNATVTQNVVLFFVSLVPPISSRWEDEMRMRRTVYEEAVAIKRRRLEDQPETRQNPETQGPDPQINPRVDN